MSPERALEGTVMYSSLQFIVKSTIYHSDVTKMYVWGKLWGKENHKIMKNYDL